LISSIRSCASRRPSSISARAEVAVEQQIRREPGATARSHEPARASAAERAAQRTGHVFHSALAQALERHAGLIDRSFNLAQRNRALRHGYDRNLAHRRIDQPDPFEIEAIPSVNMLASICAPITASDGACSGSMPLRNSDDGPRDAMTKISRWLPRCSAGRSRRHLTASSRRRRTRRECAPPEQERYRGRGQQVSTPVIISRHSAALRARPHRLVGNRLAERHRARQVVRKRGDRERLDENRRSMFAWIPAKSTVRSSSAGERRTVEKRRRTLAGVGVVGRKKARTIRSAAPEAAARFGHGRSRPASACPQLIETAHGAVEVLRIGRDEAAFSAPAELPQTIGNEAAYQAKALPRSRAAQPT
jgi:hypothetical protein